MCVPVTQVEIEVVLWIAAPRRRRWQHRRNRRSKIDLRPADKGSRKAAQTLYRQLKAAILDGRAPHRRSKTAANTQIRCVFSRITQHGGRAPNQTDIQRGVAALRETLFTQEE